MAYNKIDKLDYYLIKAIKDDYINWLSVNYMKTKYGFAIKTLQKILVSNWVILRTLSEANKIKFNDWTLKNKISKGKLWKQSWALWKTRTFDRIIKKPNNTWNKNPQRKWWKTKLTYQIRNSVEYKYWRKKIFERDLYTCVWCLRKRKKWDRVVIQADHIYPLCKIIDDYEIKSMEDAISCNELWDINNWRTLCKECHKKTSTYWVNIKNDKIL